MVKCPGCGTRQRLPLPPRSTENVGPRAKETTAVKREGTAMVGRMWLFGLILAVPLIGLAVSEGIQAYFNSEVRSVLRTQNPNSEGISEVTLDRLCESRDFRLNQICSTNANLNLMSAGAVGAVVAGSALLLVIWLAGRAARNRRRLLLYLFKPGLYITALTLIALVLVHAAVAIGAIYYGESALIGRIHIGIIAAIGLGALGGVVVIARNVFSLVRKAQTLVIGVSLSRGEAPQLWNRVEQIAERLGALRPQNIVVGLDPNFFVTEATVICLRGTLSGRTLYCSLPLSRILSSGEFSAVIGHELGHFKGLDTKFSESFYPIYRGTASSIASLQETGGEGSTSIALLPAIAILGYFLECFSVAESRISRDRELAADQAGASLTDPGTMASALVKVHAFSGLWGGLQSAAAEALQEGKAFVNASKTYAEAVASTAELAALEGIAETRLSHPTDSHPPLGVRLGSLDVTLNQVSAASLAVSPADAAIDLIPEFEKREEEISGAFQAILAQRLGIDLKAFTKDQGDNGA
jgi:Zn-dependent protease with chaperone function